MSEEALGALRIASFGPVDLNPDSWTYGYITSTPKPGWRNVDLAGAVRKGLDLPVGRRSVFFAWLSSSFMLRCAPWWAQMA